MTDTSRQMLKESIIPILLGSGRTAYSLASKIFWRYGIRSYICSYGKGFRSLFSPAHEHFPLYSKDDFDVQLKSVEYIADSQEFLPILVPCDDHFLRQTEARREYLESRFIVATPEALFQTKPFVDLTDSQSIF